MANDGALRYPVIAVNDAEQSGTSTMCTEPDNQRSMVFFEQQVSSWLARILLLRDSDIAVKVFAMRAKGLGANVIVTEVKPTAALKATLEGYRVMKMDDAAKIGDIFITATGVQDIIIEKHFKSMKDGAIVCNTGHYDCEINIPDLEKLAKEYTRSPKKITKNIH